MRLYSEDILLFLVYLEPIISKGFESDPLEPALGHVQIDEVEIPAPLLDLPSMVEDLLSRTPAEEPEAESVELLEGQRIISRLQLYQDCGRLWVQSYRYRATGELIRVLPVVIYPDVRISEEPRPGGVVGTFSGDCDTVNPEPLCRCDLAHHLRGPSRPVPSFSDLDDFAFCVRQGTLDTFVYSLIRESFHVLRDDH